MSVLFAFLAFSFVLFYYSFNRDIFHPGSIFLFVWFISCSISCINYSDFMAPWCAEMYAVTIISGFSFWLGTIIFMRKKTFKSIEKKELSKELSFILYFLFVVCFLAMIIEWINGGMNLNVVMSEEDVFDQKSEIDGAIPGIHYGTIFLPFVAILFYFKVLNSKKKKNQDRLIIFLIIAISVLVNLSRGDLLIYILSFTFLYSRYNEIKLKNLVSVVILILVVFIGIVNIRLSESSIVFTATTNPYFSIFYSYIATCFANLNDFIISDDHFHFMGNATFSPIWTLTGLKEEMKVNEMQQLGVFNASVYIYDFYHDYKILGVIVFPFLIGLFLSRIYHNILFKSSIWVLMLAVLQKTIYVSFFGNYFFGELVLVFPYLLTYLLLLFQFSLDIFRSTMKDIVPHNTR